MTRGEASLGFCSLRLEEVLGWGSLESRNQEAMVSPWSPPSLRNSALFQEQGWGPGCELLLLCPLDGGQAMSKEGDSHWLLSLIRKLPLWLSSAMVGCTLTLPALGAGSGPCPVAPGAPIQLTLSSVAESTGAEKEVCFPALAGDRVFPGRPLCRRRRPASCIHPTLRGPGSTSGLGTGGLTTHPEVWVLVGRRPGTAGTRGGASSLPWWPAPSRW